MKIKRTGITRKMDELGRFVLPVEIRRNSAIQPGDPIEISVTDTGAILLQKYAKDCIFCGNDEDVEDVLDQAVCPECLKRIKEGRYL
jgi:transcriptional pleiotropic regulator of transition state genes